MSDPVKAARKIIDAEAAVAQAQQRGGSVDEINRANRKLADAHSYYRECSGGRVPDTRG